MSAFIGNYSIQRYAELTTHRLKDTRRIRTTSFMPVFNIGSTDDEPFIVVQPNGKIPLRKPLTKMHPIQYHRYVRQNSYKVIYSDKQIEESSLFEKKNNLGEKIAT